MVMRPPHSVPIKLKILTPVGTATTRVATIKAICQVSGRPRANMWCTQTSSDTMVMPSSEYTITR